MDHKAETVSKIGRTPFHNSQRKSSFPRRRPQTQTASLTRWPFYSPHIMTPQSSTGGVLVLGRFVRTGTKRITGYANHDASNIPQQCDGI